MFSFFEIAPAVESIAPVTGEIKTIIRQTGFFRYDGNGRDLRCSSGLFRRSDSCYACSQNNNFADTFSWKNFRSSLPNGFKERLPRTTYRTCFGWTLTLMTIIADCAAPNRYRGNALNSGSNLEKRKHLFLNAAHRTVPRRFIALVNISANLAFPCFHRSHLIKLLSQTSPRQEMAI